MKTLIVIGSMILFSAFQVHCQTPVKYAVRNKPLLILENPNGKLLVKVPKRAFIWLSPYNPDCDCFNAKYLEFKGVLMSKPWLEDVLFKPAGKERQVALTDSVKRLLIEYRLANDKDDEGEFVIAKTSAGTNGDIKRKIDLINKWGYTDGKRIAECKVWMGMTVNMTLDSWGIPYKVKRIQGNYGLREEWIYSDAYLYFENGVLSEILRVNSP